MRAKMARPAPPDDIASMSRSVDRIAKRFFVPRKPRYGRIGMPRIRRVKIRNWRFDVRQWTVHWPDMAEIHRLGARISQCR